MSFTFLLRLIFRSGRSCIPAVFRKPTASKVTSTNGIKCPSLKYHFRYLSQLSITHHSRSAKMSESEVTKDEASEMETEVTEDVENSIESGNPESPPKRTKTESPTLELKLNSHLEQPPETVETVANNVEEKPDDFIALDQIPTWPQYSGCKPKSADFNPILNAKVSLFRGDITKLQVDAIVNAANDRLVPGGGVCGAIHQAAGKELAAECLTLKGCPQGDAKITGGYALPARHVIQTVGPIGEKSDVLRSCYRRCFQVLVENNLRSIAFPCIGTGIYGFNNEKAAKIALTQTRTVLEKHHDKIDRVIFCVFLPKDLYIYEDYMRIAFPLY